MGYTYVKRRIGGRQFIIISASEQICQFLQICWLPQQMSINVTTPVTLKSSTLVRLPHPQDKLHPM